MPGFDTPTMTGTRPVTRELGRLRVTELLRFAHHPENGQAVHATLQVEFDQAVDAQPINIAVLGERCRQIAYTPFADASSS